MDTPKETITYSPITQDQSYEKHLRARDMRRSLTPAECKLWISLQGKRYQSFHFRRQQTILGFIVDFYCHKAQLIVELDGPVHQQTHLYDSQRTRILRTNGFLILRFNNDAVYYDFERVLFKISHVAHKRASARSAP